MTHLDSSVDGTAVAEDDLCSMTALNDSMQHTLTSFTPEAVCSSHALRDCDPQRPLRRQVQQQRKRGTGNY